MNRKTNLLAAAVLAMACSTAACAQQNNPNANRFMEEKLNLTEAWDKVFTQSDKVEHTKITFHNRYGITSTPLKTPRANCLPWLSAARSGL